GSSCWSWSWPRWPHGRAEASAGDRARPRLGRALAGAPGAPAGQLPGDDPPGGGRAARLLTGHEGVLADLELGAGGGLVAEPEAGVAVEPERGLDPVGALH